jgi:hypothetical protein
MTGDDIPANPNVLNTTVLSNFACIDQLWVVADLFDIYTVPVVREEIEHGVDHHPYLQSALDSLDNKSQSLQFRTPSQTEKQLSVSILIPGKHRRSPLQMPTTGDSSQMTATRAPS